MSALVTASLSLLVLALSTPSDPSADPAAPPRQAPTAQSTPEERAFQQARGAKDPAERMRALTTFRDEFPESRYVSAGTVDFNLFVAACESGRTAVAEARRASEAWFAKQPQAPDAVAWNAFGLASRFFAIESWTDAERYARRSLEAWDSRQSNKPALRFRQELRRPAVLAVLGSALFEMGRTGEAKPILEEAFRHRAQEPVILGQVGPRLLKMVDGNESRIDYLMVLALYGRLRGESRDALRQAWRESHSGRLDGLEAALDRRYREEVPGMVHVEAWTPPADSRRVSLMEVFTGTSCAPCAGVDLAAEGAIRRYGASLAVLAYHQHIPAADPLANTSGVARQRYYGREGVPSLVIDGLPLEAQGGGSVADAQQILDAGLRPTLERRLATATTVRLRLSASVARGVVTADVSVADATVGGAPLNVMLALAEKEVRYSGGNGIRFHPMVVRKLVAAGRVTDGRYTGRQSLDLETVYRDTRTLYADYLRDNPNAGSIVLPEIVPENLVVVAFLQDESTRGVLQAASVPVIAARR
jgi:hypothetical protein